MKAIYGKKIGMTRVYTAGGEVVPVTALELGPNVIHQVKTPESDGYSALQVGFGKQKAQRVNKALTGHYAKAKKGAPRFSAEIRLEEAGEDISQYNVGDVISIGGMFEIGSRVDVLGTSIGKGFAGVIKRHHMKGAQTATRGTHEYRRHVGSIGNRKFPGRVFKNKRMPGQMGHLRVVQQGLKVIEVRADENVILVLGSVPGPKNGTIMVKASVKH